MDICTKVVFTKDVVGFVLILVTIFVIREILTWYFKTNSILAKLEKILQRLEK